MLPVLLFILPLLATAALAVPYINGYIQKISVQARKEILVASKEK